MLSEADLTRSNTSSTVDPIRKSRLGQYFTSAEISRFMASLFTRQTNPICHLLDAGAGKGYLSAAFLDRWVSGGFNFRKVEVDAFEVDDSLCQCLTQTLAKYEQYPGFAANIRCIDFIHAAADWLSGSFFAAELPKYTHAILNPPYKKIRSDSEHRIALRRVGIETVNLYTAFVALALTLLDHHGQLVAIVPRSFCNGPYYRPFRNFILQRAAIRHIHLFESRSQAFKKDDVLQENIIIMLERGGTQGQVRVSTSTDSTFSDIAAYDHPFDRIVFSDDLESFIHVPTSPEKAAIELYPSIRCLLSDLGITVSTGPVVDFRMKNYLRDASENDTVPLLYPAHFSKSGTVWPTSNKKKPNAIQCNGDTEKWLYPNGFYCVVRRFSAKEEKRRIMASVVDPAVFSDARLLGFENHLNVFHEKKHGLPEFLARGLAAFLNATIVDEHFRRFNGHTQVNATDLRLMKYPDRNILIELGKWSTMQLDTTQKMLDDKLESLTA